jgi:hypothetical protein
VSAFGISWCLWPFHSAIAAVAGNTNGWEFVEEICECPRPTASGTTSPLSTVNDVDSRSTVVVSDAARVETDLVLSNPDLSAGCAPDELGKTKDFVPELCLPSTPLLLDFFVDPILDLVLSNPDLSAGCAPDVLVVHSVAPLWLKEGASVCLEVDPFLTSSLLGFELELSWIELHELSAEDIETFEDDPAVSRVKDGDPIPIPYESCRLRKASSS